jgi:serine phosphatase RsbU (regulator of sigma subunit)
MSYEEIERLVKQEAAEVYEFFRNEIPKSNPSANKLTRAIIFLRSLFNAFLMKMAPARRFFYFASLLFLIFGLWNDMDGYIVLSFIIISLLLAFELADKLLVKNELEIAQKIQTELVPKFPPELNNFEISFHYEPAKEVGGDYLDFIELPEEGNTLIVLGDVSGKGIAAALYVVRVQAIIHLLVENFVSLKNTLLDLKKYFSHNLRKEFFLTLAAAEIKKDNSISICRAGHNPLFYYNSSKKEIETIKPAGLAIGFNDKVVFDKILEEITITPQANDILFIFTDGVSETMNCSKMLFGEERIKKILQDNAAKSTEEIKRNLLFYLAGFKGDAPIADDQAFIILKRKNYS